MGYINQTNPNTAYGLHTTGRTRTVITSYCMGAYALYNILKKNKP